MPSENESSHQPGCQYFPHLNQWGCVPHCIFSPVYRLNQQRMKEQADDAS